MPDVSPGLADSDKLVGLPKAYFIVCEMDPIKDDGLLYSERLKRAGVQVEVNYYEGYHGIVAEIDEISGYQVARAMLDDLIKYIKANI